MRPVPAPVLLRALMLLLPLSACSWAPAVTSLHLYNKDRIVHLFTSSPRMGFHLQIHPNGRVDGATWQTVDSALKIKSVKPGYVVIIGVKSKLFLCMHTNGVLFGASTFNNDVCTFKHTLLENNYDVYESERLNFLVSLGHVKRPLGPTLKLPPFSQFLRRPNEIPLSQLNPPVPREGDTDFAPCLGPKTGVGIREENIGEAGINPCVSRH